MNIYRYNTLYDKTTDGVCMDIDQSTLKRIIDMTAVKVLAEQGRLFVPVAVPNRHIHLCLEDMEKLFGKGYVLHKIRDLNQPGQYVCEEKVTLVGPKGRLDGVRVLGPLRKETQAEISLTDSYKLGTPPCIRMSGDLMGTPGCRLLGRNGEIEIPRGVIIATRHLHLSKEEAALFGLKDKDTVKFKCRGIRETTLENVVVRIGEGHSLEGHIDTDEANGAGLLCGQLLELIK